MPTLDTFEVRIPIWLYSTTLSNMVLTLPWNQSSQATHWTISSSLSFSGSGYGLWHEQYLPSKFWLYLFSSFKPRLFCKTNKSNSTRFTRPANTYRIDGARRVRKFSFDTTVAAEVSLSVQFIQLMAFMTLIRTGQTDTAIRIARLLEARLTSVQGLSCHVALEQLGLEPCPLHYESDTYLEVRTMLLITATKNCRDKMELDTGSKRPE